MSTYFLQNLHGDAASVDIVEAYQYFIANEKDFSAYPRRLQAEFEGAGGGGADRVLDLARGDQRGLPGPDELPVRPRVGRRSGGVLSPPDGVLAPGRHDPLPGRSVSRLRRGGARHGAWQRGRGGRAAAAGRRDRRRGLHPCGPPGLGGEQRRSSEGGLHGARSGRPGGGHRRGAGARRGEPGDDRLRRGARDGHADRRSDRGGGPDPGLPRRDAGASLLRARIAEDEPRPPRRRRRRRGASR